MATKVVVCPECDAPLDGRFSCSTCGAVVAAVASDRRSFSLAGPVLAPMIETAAPAVTERDEPAAQTGPGDSNGWHDSDPEPVAEAVPAAPVVASASGAAYASVVPAPPATSWPEQPAWPEQPVWPPAQNLPLAPEPPARTPAGAYLPPSAVLPPGEALPVNGKNGNGHAMGTDVAAKPKASLAERFALGEGDGPLGLPANAPGRTIALGAALAGLGLILPWAEIVIGSASMGGFLDQWGLAAPGHPIVLLLLIGVGALAVAHERWPVRVGAGTSAIVLGSVVIGLAFPYVMGPFREAVGVYVTVAGAVVMIIGGLLARAAQRHEVEDASV
jgi:hypothetical protein